jgi:hypothetical protein
MLRRLKVATVKNVSGSSRNKRPNAGKQYEQLTGKPVPVGMVVAHVTVEGEGRKQFLVPVTCQ